MQESVLELQVAFWQYITVQIPDGLSCMHETCMHDKHELYAWKKSSKTIKKTQNNEQSASL